jgi:UDP-2,3-diacylglucosamine pyrophosphatase LpxH
MSFGLTIEPLKRTVFRVEVPENQELLFISDVHYDAMKCDRDLLTKHLTEAKKRGAAVFIFGDWFDLMQGKWDPRGTYSDLRPEYKSITYLDDVINDSVEYFNQFKGTIRFLGRGNHETNIEKRMHTSPLDRVAALHNAEGGNITVGGYAGWLQVRMVRDSAKKVRHTSYVHFHHGYGGNAPRSKGVLAVDLDQMQFPDADIIVRGHTHQKWYVPTTVDRITSAGNLYQQRVHHLRTGSYKLLGDRFAGWATEKGFNTPTLGGWWLRMARNRKNDTLRWEINEAN